MFQWLSPVSGAALVALVLSDVYLTVLYARSGAGILSPRLGSWTWRVFRVVGKLFPSGSDTILSFCGPTVLVVIGSVWVGGILVGFGLIVWPFLGSMVVSTQSDAPQDFATAVYVSGYYMTTVGNGDFRPTTAAFKLLLILDSILGMSLITLMLTYFVQVYTALQNRSTFALKLHKGTAGTGDAAELLARIGADGNFGGARGALAIVADELLGVYESYHFYDVLIFFRFRDPHYSLPRAALLVMDTATLIRTALDGQKYGFLIRSLPVAQLWHGGQHSLRELSRVFLPPKGEPTRGRAPDALTDDRWRRRYAAAIARLRAEGIETVSDHRAGADAYVSLRAEWDAPVAAFTAYLRYSPEETDPAAAGSPTA